MRHGGDRARGFTLLEMLIVLTVIMIIMGLVLSGVFGSRKINKLVATEQMIGDMVRQARHAARSTGEPVVLVFRKDQREISGVSRVPIRSEAFESGVTTDQSYGNVQGRTGRGRISSLSVVPPATGWISALAANERIERSNSTSRPSSGFYLACDIRPPAAADASEGVIPLACVGPSPVLGTTVCGIALERVDLELQDGPGGSTDPRFMTCWNIRGWARINGVEQVVSQIDHIPYDLENDLPPQPLHVTSPDDDVHGPLVGGFWEDIGLLYDGQRLVLYRNGRRIAETLASGHLESSPNQSVYANRIEDWGTPATDYGYSSDVIIDNLRLFRLSNDQAGVLPPGMSSRMDYRITAHPDGRVEVNAAAEIAAARAANDPDRLDEDHLLYFTGSQDLDDEVAGTWAVITISSVGKVTGEIRALDTATEDADTVIRIP
ncbi:MAG TPA: type II secretion system protein [Planctomycetota bacterium]|nr:type II secretion system protein [Planctomycetota bacterium]